MISICRDIFVKSLERKSEMIKRIHGTIIKYDLFEYSVKNGIVALKLYEGWSNYLLNQRNDTQKMYRGFGGCNYRNYNSK